ncbi:MAG: cytochrome c [Steroidobacteraceae bacterium]
MNNRTYLLRSRRTLAMMGLGGLVAAGALAQGGPTVWDGVYNAEQAERGREIYATTCALCHGPALGGVESAPPLTGDQFNANWSGTTIADLAERIRISMPVDKPGTLSRPQLAAVVAYILKVDGFPAGAAELDPQLVTSSPVKIISNKPE